MKSGKAAVFVGIGVIALIAVVGAHDYLTELGT